ncbi:hypothetical protein QTP88_024562 [Uroleucon formosanum]
MPKINANIFNKYVKQFGEDTFATDGTMLYCKICEVKVSADKKFTVIQHIKTNKHKRLLARRNKPAENKQQFISQPSNKKYVFSHDLFDKLVAKEKQVFLKAPSRVLFFETEAPGVPLPPEPVLTRWGSWIEATYYYCQYFKQVRDVMQHFDSNDAVSIKESQTLLNEI